MRGVRIAGVVSLFHEEAWMCLDPAPPQFHPLQTDDLLLVYQ